MNTIIKIEPIQFQWPMENPFIFCAHHQDSYPAGNPDQSVKSSLEGRMIGNDFSGKDGFSMYHGSSVPGFPVHPHRGFETVTIVLEGVVDHFDSKGSKGRYANGDVQWLNTGNGSQHTEMFPLVNQEGPNPLNLFQIWLNLPRAKKREEADYKMLWSEDIPVVDKDGVNIRVIAGNWYGVQAPAPISNSWANDPENHVGIVLINMEPNAKVVIPASTATLNRNLYYYKGKSVTIDGKEVEGSTRIKLVGDQEISIVNGEEESQLILLEGEPIREPVVAYGPFVMNSYDEIDQSIREYQMTEFGGWPWEADDPVNSIESGRFAKYPDGHIENRSDTIKVKK